MRTSSNQLSDLTITNYSERKVTCQWVYCILLHLCSDLSPARQREDREGQDAGGGDHRTANKGLLTCLKHFAQNGQETSRKNCGWIRVWANEQAIREIHLKAFENPTEEVKTMKYIVAGLRRYILFFSLSRKGDGGNCSLGIKERFPQEYLNRNFRGMFLDFFCIYLLISADKRI
ncbi:MAG: hypothetical protein IK099_11975 [Clostridia bacterium]|nr:hypothetical protein [Clostridia bacterium]